MMTREEAIVNLEKLIALFHTASEQSKMVDYSKIIETLEFAAVALRPISREQVEKAWRGCSWCNNEGKKPENWECSLLDDRGFSVVVGDEVVWTNAEFCPVCGKPLTDEAVDMVMERLEALRDEKG